MLKLILLDIANIFWFGPEESALEVNCTPSSCQQSYQVTQQSYKATEAGIFAVSHVGCLALPVSQFYSCNSVKWHLSWKQNGIRTSAFDLCNYNRKIKRHFLAWSVYLCAGYPNFLAEGLTYFEYVYFSKTWDIIYYPSNVR